MFRHGVWLWATVFTFATQLCAAASSSNREIIPGAYIVSLRFGQTSGDFLHELEDTGYHGKLGQIFASDAMNGLSFTLENGQTLELDLASIESLPSVIRVWSDSIVRSRGSSAGPIEDFHFADSESRKRSTTVLPQNLMAQVDRLHADGITGEGVHVAIVDSGIQYTHPEFGLGERKGCFGTDCLVTTGYDFIGDNFDSNLNDPVPDTDPYDTCNEHGTVNAGLIASQGHNSFGMIGVSPGVTLGAYRVLGCNGSTPNSLFVSAISKAYQDGADIINLSYGGDDGWGEGPEAEIIQSIVANGTIVVACAGNGGLNGQYSTVAPGTTVGATTVGSAQNLEATAFLFRGTFTITNETQPGQRTFGFTRGEKNDWPDLPTTLLVLGADDPNMQACQPIVNGTLGNISDQIIMVAYFTKRPRACYAYDQAVNLINAGAKYVLFYGEDNGWEFVHSQVAGTDLLASGFVNHQQAQEWIDLIKEGLQVKLGISATELDGYVAFGQPTINPGGAASYFSSIGPTYHLNQYVTIMAPGGDVLSITFESLGAYATVSGTSQATPFLAGVYALLKSAMKKSGRTVSPQILENMVAITAKPNIYTDPVTFETHSFLAPTFRQGAGNIQAYDALHSTTYINVSKVEFNDTVHTGPRSFEIFNNGEQAVTYRMSNVASATFYFLGESGSYQQVQGSPQFDLAHAELNFDQSRVEIQPGQSVVVTVSATPPKLKDELIPTYSGYIAINGSDGNSWSIPYMGVACDYGANIPVLRTEDTYLYDWLDRGSDANATTNVPPSPANMTFIVPYPPDSLATDAPPAGYHFPAVNTRVPFFSYVTRIDAEPLDPDSLPSNWTTREQLGITVLGPGTVSFQPIYRPPVNGLNATYWWDGTMSDWTIAPAGPYRLWVSVLKAFGDEARAEDYVQIATVPFNLRYNDTTVSG